MKDGVRDEGGGRGRVGGDGGAVYGLLPGEGVKWRGGEGGRTRESDDERIRWSPWVLNG